MFRGVRPFINSAPIHSLTYIVPGNHLDIISEDFFMLRKHLRWIVPAYGLAWSWYLKLGELQGSREYSEGDRRWLCSVFGGTCVTDAGIDEDTWWFTGDTAECLGCSLPLVGQHGLVSGCVSDVEGFRVCLRLQQRCGGILWNDTTPLASTQPARERPPPEPPPAKERIPPEPPPTCESC